MKVFIGIWSGDKVVGISKLTNIVSQRGGDDMSFKVDGV